MTQRPPYRFATLRRALVRTVVRFNDRGGWVMSSHVAMSMMLAIFPFLLFIVALAGEISGGVPNEKLIDLIFGSWPQEIAQPIESEVRAVLSQSKGELVTVGGLLTLLFASNGVDALRLALTQAYHDQDKRPYWKQRLICFIFVIVGAALVLLIAFLGFALPIYLQLATGGDLGLLSAVLTSDILSNILTLGFLVFSVVAFNLWLPGRQHALRRIWPGIVLTIALWFAAGATFSFYLSRFASYAATYAGLAGAMSALIFLYLMAAILIFGAEFNGRLIATRDGN